MALFIFLLKVFVISFSGAMQPGPVTAAAITLGTRNRYAGLALALGHAIIELPLMFLILAGMDKLLKLPKTQIVIGFAGGAVLLVMATQMLSGLKKKESRHYQPLNNKPVLAGLILSGGNPYFLLWWATVGLALASEAVTFGLWVFGLFAVVHLSVDFIWLHVLSWTSFKGARLLGPRNQKAILMICSLALYFFGLFFIYNAAGNSFKLLSAPN